MYLDQIGEVVYLFHAEETDLFKIGRTADLHARKRQLQTGCPYPLLLVGTIEGNAKKTEQELHQMFSEYRRSGEWFEIPDQRLVRRFFQTSEIRDANALQFILFQATQVRVSIYTCKLFNQHEDEPVLRFQLMPDDEMHPFWTYYRKERNQYHASPVQAAADWIDAFNNWPGKTEWQKRIGDTYYLESKSGKDGFACPNCSWPIVMTEG